MTVQLIVLNIKHVISQIKIIDIWRPPGLSELTPIISNIVLTHLNMFFRIKLQITLNATFFLSKQIFIK